MSLLPLGVMADRCLYELHPLHTYSFLRPSVLVSPDKAGAPYLTGFTELYERYGRQDSIQVEDNIREWWERCCTRPEPEDIYALIYSSSLEELQFVGHAVADPSSDLKKYRNNSFARYLQRRECTEIINYLIFAKRCEDYVVRPNPWEDRPRDVRAMRDLIREGRGQFKYLKSHYVRLRYAYQLVRLAHYAGDYERALELYDYCMPKTDNDPSIIEHWIVGHKAGALMALGRNVEATYLYAQVFQNCPSKRESAYRSFKINNDREWKDVLLMCRDDYERASLHAMRAASPKANLLQEMEAIYRLKPKSPYLESLLVREMRRLEQDLLGLEFNPEKEDNRRYYGIPRAGAPEKVIALQQFVRRLLREEKIIRPEFWRIALGYLELMAADYYSAEQSFALARPMVENPELKQQLEIMSLVLKISSFSRVNDATENALYELYRFDETFERDVDFEPLFWDKLTTLYAENDHPGKAFILQYPLEYLQVNPQPSIVDDLLAIFQQRRMNKLERALVDNVSQTDSLDLELYHMKALRQWREFRMAAAYETFKNIDEDSWQRFGLHAPFRDSIRDCVSCRPSVGTQLYTKGRLLEVLQEKELEARARTGPSDTLYYELGLAFYNMTYFGNAWRIADQFRSGSSLNPDYLKDGDHVVPHPNYPMGNLEHFDCSQARVFFERARLLTGNPELGARAAFWAAKCDRNAYYVNRARGAKRDYRFFDMLQESYRETEFYDKLVEQCRTFADYVQ